MLATVVLLGLAVCLVTALFIWRRDHFQYFKKLGIPGPEPSIIWGNLREYHSMESFKVLGKWIEKYGSVFGFFNGDAPIVVLSDLDFIEYVFVRNFQNFSDRGYTMMTDQMHPVIGKSVMHVDNPDWKPVRNAVAYSMSTAKLKMTLPSLEEDSEFFLKSLEKYCDTGEEVNMLQLFEQLSLDYTAHGAFGIQERFQGKPDHPLLHTAKETFREVIKGPFHMIAQSTTSMLVWMKPFYWFVSLVGKFSFGDLGKETVKVIEMRKKDPSLRRPDILQNLIDAAYVEDSEVANGASPKKGFLKSTPLTTAQISSTSAVVFVGGFETTSASLSYASFVLAKYPEVQERVREEVLDALSQSGSLDYETVMRKLKYLGQVVDETLRLYPPGLLFVTRRAKESFEYNGVKFKAGTAFMVPQYHIQRDPRYWPDAEEFIPERFAPENEGSLKKTAYTPFGVGPRNCVGKRLGLWNMKYTIARIVQRYRLELGKSQMGSMELSGYGVVSTPARGPWIILHRV